MILTIIIPIILIKLNIELNIIIIPVFIILCILFIFLNNNAHKVYLKKEDLILEKGIEDEKKWEKSNIRKTTNYTLILVLTGIVLFFIGEYLGESLELLCKTFDVPEFIVGIILGFITSIPELITFLESQKHYKKTQNNILGVVEATNNLFTSNLLNLFVIQGIGIILIEIIH